jgi:hypothetical protein
MAWDYDPSKFSDSTVGTYPPATLGQLMQVRFLVQDTKYTRQLLQDDEIYWMITQEANVFMAAAACCDSLVASAGNIKSKKISEFFISYDIVFYTKLAGMLRARGAGHQVPYAGGISISDKEAQQANSDWVSPTIGIGLDNHPNAPQPTLNPTNPLTTI